MKYIIKKSLHSDEGDFKFLIKSGIFLRKFYGSFQGVPWRWGRYHMYGFKITCICPFSGSNHVRTTFLETVVKFLQMHNLQKVESSQKRPAEAEAIIGIYLSTLCEDVEIWQQNQCIWISNTGQKNYYICLNWEMIPIKCLDRFEQSISAANITKLSNFRFLWINLKRFL